MMWYCSSEQMQIEGSPHVLKNSNLPVELKRSCSIVAIDVISDVRGSVHDGTLAVIGCMMGAAGSFAVSQRDFATIA